MWHRMSCGWPVRDALSQVGQQMNPRKRQPSSLVSSQVHTGWGGRFPGKAPCSGDLQVRTRCQHVVASQIAGNLAFRWSTMRS